MSRSNSSQNNVTANSNGASNQMLIHLGNYIISVPKNYAPEPDRAQSPVKGNHQRNKSSQSKQALTAVGAAQLARERSRSPAVALPTTEMQSGSQSAIQFELNWIKFVKEAEDEYNRRMCRNEKPQPLSVFEVNVDVFELYLMKVSGRALQKIQSLNLDLKSSLCADMKLFDNQSGLLPPEHVMEADQNAELEKRRQKRLMRRQRNKRQTAHFNTNIQEMEAALLEEGFIQSKGETEQSLQQTHLFSMVDSQSPQPASIAQESPDQILQHEPIVIIEQLQIQEVMGDELKLELKEVVIHPSSEIPQSIIQQPEPEIIQANPPEQHPPQMEEEIKQHLIDSPPPVPKKKKVMIDSLNDRSDDEDGSPGGEGDRESSPIQETEEDEFARDDMTITAGNARPVLQVFNSNGLTDNNINKETIDALHVIGQSSDVMSPELRTPEQNNTLAEGEYQNNMNHHEDAVQNNLEISIDDQEHQVNEPQKLINEEPIVTQQTPVVPEKIKIGDMTIEDPYMSINEQPDAMCKSAIQDSGMDKVSPDVGMSGEHYTMQDVTDPMLDNSNPFREKSVLSYINSPKKSHPQTNSDQNNQSHEEVQIQHQDSQELKQQATANQQLNKSNMARLKEEEVQIPRSTTDPTHLNVSQQRSNRSHLDHQSENIVSGHTHRQPNMIQINSQQSLDPIDQTGSHKDLLHNIAHERNQEVIVNGNLADQSMSAITTGRQIQGHLSAMNTVRVPLDEEIAEAPEREVVLRFEVAVGTTPLNLTFDEGSALYEHPPNKNEAAVTPLDRTVEQMRDNLPELIKVDAGASQDKIAKHGNDVALSPHILPSQNSRYSKSQPHREAESHSPTRSLNASQEKQAKSLTPSRLEVTLTAEPDKPIMVEVRGGEKQFLISALTKHIYDILSQPNRLHIMQDENGNVQFGDSSDPNAPGQHLEPVIDNTGQGAFKVGNQNINLRLKSVKKDDNLGLPMLQNLGGKNIQQSTQQNSNFHESLPQVRASQQKVNQSQQEIRQSLENIRHSNHVQSAYHYQDESQSVHGETALAKDQSGYIKQQVNQPQKNIRISQSPQSVKEQQAIQPKPHIQQEPKVVVQQEVEIKANRKRTTVVASTDGKIQEEQIHSSFEGEIPLESSEQQRPEEANNVAKTPTLEDISISKQTSNEGSFRKIRHEASSPHQRLMNAQEQLRSRPETANFNKAYAAATDQIDNPFINGQEDENSSVTQPQLETPKRQDEHDISIADQTNTGHQKSRLETPGADSQEGIPYEQQHNSSIPADFEEYVKSPLHPTIPEQHHNGYFSTESDYIMVMPAVDGHSLGNGGSSNSNDQYLTPKLAYFDQFNQAPQNQSHTIPTPQQIQQQLMRHQSINDFYSSQYGYSDAEQNIEDFILAEGYPLLNFIQKDGNGRNSLTSLKTEIQSSQSKRHPDIHHTQQLNRSNKGQKLYDFNGPASYSHQNTLTHANLSTPPNAYRIRKVILPNYPNAINTTNQSDVEDSQKPSPLSTHHNHNLRPLFNNMLQPNAPAASALLRKQKTIQASTKQLPVVKTRKRIFNNTVNSTIYSVNGGPAQRSIPLSQSLHARSLSPLRKKNHIFYTSNYIMTQKKVLEQLQQLNAVTQASTLNNNGTLSNQTLGGQLTVDDFAQFAYYSQSPQPRIKPSPYLSDDEYKILQNYYDIQCEPTGMNRAGVPLMKVKRVNKPKNRTFNIFNFPDDPTANVTLPKALTSLQIFYPQFQPSNAAEYMARTMASPSKWFDRFNQSTRNLNQTITNLHQQHSRKLRSYSISNLTSQNSAAVDTINDSRNMKARSGSHNSLFQKRNQIKERQAAMEQKRRDNNSLSPPEMTQNNLSDDFGKRNLRSNKKAFMKDSGATNSSSTFMPPLQKIYMASLSHHHENSQDKSRMSKKSTASSGVGSKNLPPRPHNKKANVPKIGINVLGGDHQTPSKSATPTSDNEGKTSLKQKNLLMPTQSANIINTNHNQYVCFGVNIITKSDK